MLTFKEAAEIIKQEMDHNMSIYRLTWGKIGLCNVCHNVDGIAYRRVSIAEGTEYQECISCFWKRRLTELNPIDNERAERLENVKKYFSDRKKRDIHCALEF